MSVSCSTCSVTSAPFSSLSHVSICLLALSILITGLGGEDAPCLSTIPLKLLKNLSIKLRMVLLVLCYKTDDIALPLYSLKIVLQLCIAQLNQMPQVLRRERTEFTLELEHVSFIVLLSPLPLSPSLPPSPNSASLPHLTAHQQAAALCQRHLQTLCATNSLFQCVHTTVNSEHKQAGIESAMKDLRPTTIIFPFLQQEMPEFRKPELKATCI